MVYWAFWCLCVMFFCQSVLHWIFSRSGLNHQSAHNVTRSFPSKGCQLYAVRGLLTSRLCALTCTIDVIRPLSYFSIRMIDISKVWHYYYLEALPFLLWQSAIKTCYKPQDEFDIRPQSKVT